MYIRVCHVIYTHFLTYSLQYSVTVSQVLSVPPSTIFLYLLNSNISFQNTFVILMLFEYFLFLTFFVFRKIFYIANKAIENNHGITYPSIIFSKTAFTVDQGSLSEVLQFGCQSVFSMDHD